MPGEKDGVNIPLLIVRLVRLLFPDNPAIALITFTE